MSDSWQRWHVHIKIHCPVDMPDEKHDELYAAEAKHCLSPEIRPYLVELFRIPATKDNMGIWKAPDATTLHAAISSFPLFRYMDVTVTPLAEHPNDPKVRARREAEAEVTAALDSVGS